VLPTGFAALKPVLVHEGIYASYCDNEHDGEKSRLSGRPCVGQDLQLNLSFTISVVLTNVGALPIGMTLDRIGPKYTSILGAIIFALGNIFLGINADAAGFDTFLVGYILLALGGPMIFLSAFHLCNAFPKVSLFPPHVKIGAERLPVHSAPA
jgi:MFS family permease